MNIFATYTCPTKSARFLDNTRVIKMILESAQMMCTAINYNSNIKVPYKSTHLNHPCNIWARKTQGNYRWLYLHWLALNREYTKRYQKTHKTYQYLELFSSAIICIPDGELTPFVNCARNTKLGLDFTKINDVHIAYQEYLKKRFRKDKRPAVCKL